MSNSSNRPPHNLKATTKIGSQENINSHVEAVSPTSYQEGYIHGRASERSLENERQEIRDENTASRALLIGIGLTSLIGLTAGTLFFLNQNQQPESPAPIVVPQRNAPPSPTKETTIIERTTEIQQPPPVEQDRQTSQPNIQITVPTSEQKPTSTQPNTKPSALPEQSKNQSIPTNPTATQRNTAPQSTEVPSPTNPSSTINPTSSGQPENQSSTGTTTTTQPNTTNQSLPTQTQNQNQSSNSGQ